MKSFTNASIVIIPTRTGKITFDLGISVADQGEMHNAFTNTQKNVSALVARGEIIELDITNLIPATILTPGKTYVSIKMWKKFRGRGRIPHLFVNNNDHYENGHKEDANWDKNEEGAQSVLRVLKRFKNHPSFKVLGLRFQYVGTE
ncbi:MAG: hypothetical protein O7F12_06425, partial [Nitrospirae bacterium]|nr:hypothetical protein [Nitrospirota bacterium]